MVCDASFLALQALNDITFTFDHLLSFADTTIFLAGDSSLDNKHWFFKDGFKTKKEQITARKPPTFIAGAQNGFEHVLSPPVMVMDVAYWMNSLSSQRFGSGKVVTLNAAVEESTVGERVALLKGSGDHMQGSGLLRHDMFVRDALGTRGREDVVVLSVATRSNGANLFVAHHLWFGRLTVAFRGGGGGDCS